MASDEEQCDGLIEWLASYNLPSLGSMDVVEAHEALTTGVPIAEALQKFDLTNFSSIDVTSDIDASSHWQLRATNIRKCTRAIRDYYDAMERESSVEAVDDEKICNNMDREEMCKLLRLVVGIALVLCPSANDNVMKCSSLPPGQQMAVMLALKALNLAPETPRKASSSTPQSPDKSRPNSKLERTHSSVIDVEENINFKALYDESRHECETSKKRVYELEHEYELLVKENERLLDDATKRAIEMDRCVPELQGSIPPSMSFTRGASPDRQSVNGKTLTTTGNMSARSESDEDNRPASTAARHVQMQLGEAELQNEELHAQVSALTQATREKDAEIDDLLNVKQDYLRLKDENDELHRRSDEASKALTANEVLRRKLDEQTDLKRENRILQTKNDQYMKAVIDLEEEQNRTATFRQQLEAAKRRYDEMEKSLETERKRADDTQFGIDKLEKQRAALRDELTMVKGERDSFRMGADDSGIRSLSESAELANGASSSLSPDLSDAGDVSLALAKNAALGAQNTVSIDEHNEVVAERDALVKRKTELLDELRQEQQSVRQLSSKIDDLSDAEQMQSSTDTSATRLHDIHAQYEKLLIEQEKMKLKLDDAHRKGAEKDILLQEKRTELDQAYSTASTSANDKEMNSDEKSIVDKAITVIAAQDAQIAKYARQFDNDGTLSKKEFDTIANERDAAVAKYQRLYDEMDKSRVMHEQEMRLIVSHWHQMSNQVVRLEHSTENGYAADAPQSSMLARQRQSTHSAASGNRSGAQAALGFHTGR